MNHFIKAGGVLIIAAVFGIFLFIAWQVLPLFRSAKVEPLTEIPLPAGTYALMGVDEWGEKPLFVTPRGEIITVDVNAKKAEAASMPAFTEPKEFSTFRYKQQQRKIVYGTADGFVSVVDAEYEPDYSSKLRAVGLNVKPGAFLEIGAGRHRITDVDYADSGDHKLVAAVQKAPGSSPVLLTVLNQERTLFGVGDLVVGETFDLTSQVEGTAEKIAVGSHADHVIVATRQGELFYFYFDGSRPELRQRFSPFGDLKSTAVRTMDFLLGGVSLVLTNPEGVNRVFSLYMPEGQQGRVFNRVHDFPPLPGSARFYSGSLRNKAFLLGTDDTVSLRYATTTQVRWKRKFDFKIQAGVLNDKYNRILLLDQKNILHVFRLTDRFPEAGWRAFFGKIWYEGAAEPRYEWQSTGGTDEFEAKLSLMPLIIGTLKGTFYALVFAIPVALLAAIYTALFMQRNLKILIKPLMEVMASLPSVVLGFLAALWLAPLLEDKVPAILAALVLVPFVVLAFGILWNTLPKPSRSWLHPGYEFLLVIPLVFVTVGAAVLAGPFIERVFFSVQDPATGRMVADFRLWWIHTTGASFEQRNALVVGFIMGFAVIPIVFTIAEDALSNVPAALTSASLALGASRWQTALGVALPVASGGILSAVMVGFGRAVGETMIVVMATGNTPIMDFNIFSGMRTLSANIAVELPEAPAGETLYRTLFLGALLLFLITFLVNTCAEVLRQRIREKYKML